MKPFIRLFALSIAAACLSGCQSESPSQTTLSATAAPTVTKKVEVTIESIPPRSKYSTTIAYAAAPDNSSQVQVSWDGDGFAAKSDGRELFNHQHDIAFDRPKGDFKISKKITLGEGSGSTMVTTSTQNVTVQRGVKAVF